MKLYVFLLVTACLLVCRSASVPAQDSAAPVEQDAPKPEAKAVDDGAKREALRKSLGEALTGATLVGYFTVDDENSDKPLKPDRYTIARVTPVKDDYFLFLYVHQGVPIPLTLKVLWAGDTPVLTLDEFTIAGMGTFSARLMFRLKSDRYAGTWQHGKTGGLMFGRIERAKNPEPKPAASTTGNPVPEPADKSNRDDGK
ncbi:MAG: hypothetical protein ACYTGL_17210 [Planctomycetota bacterium]